MKNKLTEAIQEILVQLFPDNSLENIDIEFQVPKGKDNGDLSTNIAMKLAGQLKKNPREIAVNLQEGIETKELVDKIEVAGPGFLNFFLKKEDVFSQLDTMIKEDVAYGQNAKQDEAINVEYVSVNPTGDLHIGHARGAVYGDVMANLLEKAGYDVTREYYINDAGNQIDKLGTSTDVRYRQLLGEDIPMPEDGYHAEDIKRIAQQYVDEYQDKIAAMSSDDRKSFFKDETLKRELEQIATDLDSVGIEHDVWFSERTLYADNKIVGILDELKERGMTYEDEGAIWLKSTMYGDDKDRVLVKTDGSYTYLTPDIAYHNDKLNRLENSNKKLIDVLGGDHHGYVARMKAALQTLGYPEDILTVCLIQMVRFIKDGEEVKMSKRTGNAISMRELVEEVGEDAMRYFFSARSCDTPLDFDMDLAVETSSNNPVYYLHYAHARICSTIARAEKELFVKIDELSYNNDYSLLVLEEEHELAIKLNQFTDIVLNAAQRLEPFKITNYLQELTAAYHKAYRVSRVLGAESKELSMQRLKLMLATRAVLRSGFAIIGISAPESM